MFGKILFITENIAHIENIVTANQVTDLMNINVVFEAPEQRILGEVAEINDQEIIIRFLGEFVNNKYISGILRKPVLSSTIRVINEDELKELVGTYNDTTFKIGQSAIYKDHTICANINNLLSNHMAIFGNSGSGKSCGVARIIQNIFGNLNLFSYNANIFIFDAYGEYKTAFTKLHEFNSNYCYKFITTVPTEEDDFLLQVPFHLLGMDDLTLLLQADKHSQLPIIERSLKLTKIFSKGDEEAAKYKNHLIAKALMAILYSNQITASKKNEIFKILEVCHTPEFDFDTSIQGLGYTRSFSECLEIDSNGNFGESVLITNYILGYIDENLEMTKEPVNAFYTMRDFANGMEFTLISEGFQNNEQLYGDAILLKVRINAILNSSIAKIYEYDSYISTENYVANLVLKKGQKAQVININMEDVDDVQAKVAVKIISRMLFEFVKKKKQRASMPFHVFLEEAHRYVQNDTDTFLIGYNIFDRIAKEGRKYGILLNIISQRPVDISDTVISQCSNFLIFKMTHPRDIDYIRKMLPNISDDVVEKQKSLQPGSCVAFGTAFKLPMIIKMELPNPMPYSSNCDVNNRWKGPDGINNPTVSNPGVSNQVSSSFLTSNTSSVPTPPLVAPIVEKPNLLDSSNNEIITNLPPMPGLEENKDLPKFINSVHVKEEVLGQLEAPSDKAISQFLMAGPNELDNANQSSPGMPVEIQGQTMIFTQPNQPVTEPQTVVSPPNPPVLQEVVEPL